MGMTLTEKVWRDHVAFKGSDGVPDLLYIDLHPVHEVTSPQAFEGLRLAGRPVCRPDLTIVTEDHNIPTADIDLPTANIISHIQIETLRANCAEFGVRLHSLGDTDQGIIRAVGSQLGLTQPGMIVVCGDSHTSTHGAFGALTFGIGTFQVEHVLTTQVLPIAPLKTTSVTIDGDPPSGSGAKDIILAIIAKIGTNGARGHVIEYRGRAVEQLPMETRMTICNTDIEGGARAGTVAPGQATFDCLKGHPYAPVGEDWDAAAEYWPSLCINPDAVLGTEVVLQVEDIEPFVTWGTNPEQDLPLSTRVPDPEDIVDATERLAAERVLEYMDLVPGTPLRGIKVDTIFTGPYTNGRIEGLRVAAEVVRGRKKAEGLCMPVASALARVHLQVEAEGLDRVFTSFGAEWCNAGYSMCLAMNLGKLSPGERTTSTFNRNFEGRRGKGGQTHPVPPVVAAAIAVYGALSAPEDLPPRFGATQDLGDIPTVLAIVPVSAVSEATVQQGPVRRR